MENKNCSCFTNILKVIDVAKELGYITAPEGSIIDIDKIGLYNPEQLVIITTGSQGESMSALARMSTGEHRKVTITPEDLVIFSSSPIPGNEKSVGKLIDELQKLGAEVISDDLAYIKNNLEEKKNVYRHNYVKLGFLINTIALDYAYMLKNKNK